MKLTNIFKQIIKEETIEKRFVVNKKNNKFQLYINNIPASEAGFKIEQPDKWFNQKYISLFNIKTAEEFRGKGFAKNLMEQIFNYVKNLNINIITLIVYKNNITATRLYLNCGFEIFMDYEESYCLIRRL